jgi:hypothetical protein
MARKLSIAALLVLVVAVGTAIALPRYTCRAGYHLVKEEGLGASPTGVACLRSDVGYVPNSRLPLKVGIEAGGALVAVVLSLAATRPRLVSCA